MKEPGEAARLFADDSQGGDKLGMAFCGDPEYIAPEYNCTAMINLPKF